MTTLDRIVILIPVFKPESVTVELVRSLTDRGMRTLVVIDGALEADPAVVEQFGAIGRCTLAKHFVNLGKGRALKTGMNHILTEIPDVAGVVTADADGQHSVTDILRTAEALAQNPDAMIITNRTMDAAVPFRSRFGNIFTTYSFRLLTGTRIADTLSGLRGFPVAMLPDLLKVEGERYDFELEVLIHSCTQRPVVQFPIETIYRNDNKSSFFRPIRDSALVYFAFFKYLSSSLATAVIDFLVFTAAFFALHAVLISLIIGRLVAGYYHFRVNKSIVFGQQGGARLKPALTYILAVALLMALSYAAITTLVQLGFNVFLAKAVSETVIFFLYFTFQRILLFTRKE